MLHARDHSVGEGLEHVAQMNSARLTSNDLAEARRRSSAKSPDVCEIVSRESVARRGRWHRARLRSARSSMTRRRHPRGERIARSRRLVRSGSRRPARRLSPPTQLVPALPQRALLVTRGHLIFPLAPEHTLPRTPTLHARARVQTSPPSAASRAGSNPPRACPLPGSPRPSPDCSTPTPNSDPTTFPHHPIAHADRLCSCYLRTSRALPRGDARVFLFAEV